MILRSSRGVILAKVYIEKHDKNVEMNLEICSTYFSIDAVKTYDISDNEWEVIRPFVEKICDGVAKKYTGIKVQESSFDLLLIEDEKDWGILAESENYFIVRDNEDASIYRKPDCRRIACVGDFYGEPEDAYIDPEERFCITVGCGIIKYNLQDPFEEYMYDCDTLQWIEVGRDGDNIEWCDKIEEVTDSYIVVLVEGEDRRRFNLATLEKQE
jgi:hypothetical protein